MEPWATYTHLVFLFIIVYWGLRIRRSRVRHGMLRFSLPVLGVGWFGGTVYHATRSSDLWLAMDWMPIMILSLTATYWLWRGVTGRRLYAWLAMAASMALIQLAHHVPGLRHGYHISIGYSLLALSILVPASLHCILRWRGGWLRMLSAAFAFAIAISARVLDSGMGARLLPMGTHFIWHVLGGVSAFCLVSYIFGAGEARFEDSQAAPISSLGGQ